MLVHIMHLWLAVAVLYGLLGAVSAFAYTFRELARIVHRATFRYRLRRRLRALCQ